MREGDARGEAPGREGRRSLLLLAQSLAAKVDAANLPALVPEMLAGALGARGAVLYLSQPPAGEPERVAAWGDAASAPPQLGQLPSGLATKIQGPAQVIAAETGVWPEMRVLTLPLETVDGYRGAALILAPDPASDAAALEVGAPGLAAIINLALGRVKAESQVRHQKEVAVAVQRISERAAKQMAVLPERHLWAAVQRGFRVWPDISAKGMPEFLLPLLQTLVAEARDLAHAEMAALGIGDDPTRSFFPWVFSGVPEGVAEAVGRKPRPVGVLGVVARQGETLRLREVQDHPAFRGFPEHHPAVHSLLGIPVRYRDRPLGTLYLGNKVGAEAFTEEDQRLVESILPAIALGLQQTYMQAAAEAQRSQLESLLESAPVAIMFIDAATGQVLANPSAMDLFGHSLMPENGREQYMSQLSLPDGRPLLEQHGEEALKGGHPPSRELMVRRPDGSEVAVYETTAPVMGWQDHVLGAVVVFQDVSPLRELRKLREEFAAVVVHDFRRPLESLLLEARAVTSGQQAPPMAPLLAWVHSVQQTIQQLTEMVSDLQDAAAIELGRVALYPKPTDLAALVEEVVAALSAERGSHPVSVDLQGPNVPVPLDAARTSDAIAKLLQNAAQRSPNGATIEVRVSTGPTAQVVAVRDHGAKPSPEELPKLFDRYYEAQLSRRQTGRVWLGLYIAKGLLEAQGGRVWVEPGADDGCTVYAAFPLPQSEADRHGVAA